jgi:hypothetical protein
VSRENGGGRRTGGKGWREEGRGSKGVEKMEKRVRRGRGRPVEVQEEGVENGG